MALARRYSCVLEEPLLETDQNLGKTLELLAVLGYTPIDFGTASIGPNTAKKEITQEDISFMLLKNQNSSVGLIPNRSLFTNRELGYTAYHLRY
ncbi:hypothetical protein HZA98_05050 [Candidatus Woesearchaeota archaeon]|nr:hypothetical protein [Candidatus Woesearchaeota archaeon]